MLVQKGRIALDRPPPVWSGPRSRRGRLAIPLTPEATTAAKCGRRQFPGEPTDRIIYATAATPAP